jgi:hypothetical protein
MYLDDQVFDVALNDQVFSLPTTTTRIGDNKGFIWSPTLQLWALESNASALGIGVQRFSFGHWSPTLLGIGVQRFSFGHWSPTL